jgi:hypothetical protein
MTLDRAWEKALEVADQRRQEAIREADAIRDAAERDYRDLCDAIEELRRLTASGQRLQYGKLQESILEVAARLAHPFTSREVAERLPDGIADSTSLASISTTLRRLAERGTFRVVKQGNGARPTLYEREAS